ncbi:hypothetical protein [Alkalicoccus chagannorensis]|uniref:hypothetical protein n=1 Tax=Alkalicoccus chagannorensis TaxID=427072 RepID=UPI0012EB5579|nr:hypothetical protein [Alkalicoccus chagannorensis]
MICNECKEPVNSNNYICSNCYAVVDSTSNFNKESNTNSVNLDMVIFEADFTQEKIESPLPEQFIQLGKNGEILGERFIDPPVEGLYPPPQKNKKDRRD